MDITFDLSLGVKPNDTLTNLNRWNTLTAFGILLKNTETTQDFQIIFNKLKSMGPSAIDSEINSLSTADSSVTHSLLLQFMKVIKSALERKIDYELAQAYLGLFLKVHGETILENEELLQMLESVQKCQNSGWQDLEEQLHYNLCIIKALKI